MSKSGGATRTRSTSTASVPGSASRRATTLGHESTAAQTRAALAAAPLPARATPRANETAKGALSRVARDEAALQKWSAAHRAQLDEQYLDHQGYTAGPTASANQWGSVAGGRRDVLDEERALWTDPHSLSLTPAEHRATAEYFAKQATSAANSRRRAHDEALATMHTHAAEVKSRPTTSRSAPKAGRSTSGGYTAAKSPTLREQQPREAQDTREALQARRYQQIAKGDHVDAGPTIAHGLGNGVVQTAHKNGEYTVAFKTRNGTQTLRTKDVTLTMKRDVAASQGLTRNRSAS